MIGSATSGTAGGSITATVRWTPPASTGGLPILGYQATALEMSSSAANATVIGRVEGPVLGPTVRTRQFTLTTGNYRFEVIAINATGFEPGLSEIQQRRRAVTSIRLVQEVSAVGRGIGGVEVLRLTSQR